MAEPDDNPVYAALVAVKPPELSLGGWATKAGLARNFFNLVRQHGNPKHESLEKLLDVAGVSWAQWAADLAPDGPPPPFDGPAIVNNPYSAFRDRRPRDVPVRGTPSCGEIEIDGEEIETVDIDNEIVDFVRRPAALDGRRDVYAIYFTGFSMEPRFEPGEVAYVDATRPPQIGDYVVVQLKARNGDEEDGPRIVHALVKRLVRRTAAEITLEQFNPARTFKVPAARVAAIHRIFPLAELVAV